MTASRITMKNGQGSFERSRLAPRTYFLPWSTSSLYFRMQSSTPWERLEKVRLSTISSSQAIRFGGIVRDSFSLSLRTMPDTYVQKRINAVGTHTSSVGHCPIEVPNIDVSRSAVGGLSQRDAGHGAVAVPAYEAGEGPGDGPGDAGAHGHDTGHEDLRPDGLAGAVMSPFFTVLDSQRTSPDLPSGCCPGWDALGQPGGAAVDQRPPSIGLQRDTVPGSLRAQRYDMKICVRVCVRGGKCGGTCERARVGACACVRVGGGRGRDTPLFGGKPRDRRFLSG